MDTTQQNIDKFKALAKDEFKESDHPRAENGQFGSGGGSSPTKSAPTFKKEGALVRKAQKLAKAHPSGDEGVDEVRKGALAAVVIALKSEDSTQAHENAIVALELIDAYNKKASSNFQFSETSWMNKLKRISRSSKAATKEVIQLHKDK